MPLQDDAATTLLLALTEEERLVTWRIARSDGSLTGYGAGLPALLEAMRLTRPVGRLLHRVPESALDALYSLAAQNRRALDHVVPDGPAPRRFP